MFPFVRICQMLIRSKSCIDNLLLSISKKIPRSSPHPIVLHFEPLWIKFWIHLLLVKISRIDAG